MQIGPLQVLRTAVDLDLFTPIEKGEAHAKAIASQLGIDETGVVLILDALVGLNFLSKSKNAYSLTEEARTYLLPSSPLFLGKQISRFEKVDDPWRSLTNSVRTGKPVRQVNTEEEAQQFFPELAEAIMPLNFGYAQQLAQHLNVSKLPEGARILDVAAGTGVWSIPCVLANHQLKVDALDFPSILAVTKKTVTKFGVADRYQYLSGNWRDVSWPHKVYDLVILGHILHSEGVAQSKALLKRCFDAMKPGGTVVVAEFIANDERNAPPVALLFAINMYVYTTEGCVFSESELQQMLTDCGFEGCYRMPLEGEDSPIVIARKPL